MHEEIVIDYEGAYGPNKTGDVFDLRIDRAALVVKRLADVKRRQDGCNADKNLQVA